MSSKFTAVIKDCQMAASLGEIDSFSGVLDKAKSMYEKDYNKLDNKPSINNVVLQGNKTFEDLGDNILTNTEIYNLYQYVKGL